MQPNIVPQRRRLRGPAFLIVALAIVATACGGTSATETTEFAAVASTTATGSETVSGSSITFALFDGAQSSLADFAGTPLVINFWASWCPSCVAEMSSAFRPVAEELEGQVTFLGMNIQDERDKALALLEETGVQWINAEDPRGALYVEFGGLGMPFTVYVDATGSIVDTHNGPLNETQLREAISEHFSI